MADPRLPSSRNGVGAVFCPRRPVAGFLVPLRFKKQRPRLCRCAPPFGCGSRRSAPVRVHRGRKGAALKNQRRTLTMATIGTFTRATTPITARSRPSASRPRWRSLRFEKNGETGPDSASAPARSISARAGPQEQERTRLRQREARRPQLRRAHLREPRRGGRRIRPDLVPRLTQDPPPGSGRRRPFFKRIHLRT